MLTMHDPIDRDRDDETVATATGYLSYVDGEPTEAETLEQLAELAAHAVDAGAEAHWLRATTADGERRLTVDEQKAVLVAMGEVPRAGD